MNKQCWGHVVTSPPTDMCCLVIPVTLMTLITRGVSPWYVTSLLFGCAIVCLCVCVLFALLTDVVWMRCLRHSLVRSSLFAIGRLPNRIHVAAPPGWWRTDRRTLCSLSLSLLVGLYDVSRPMRCWSLPVITAHPYAVLPSVAATKPPFCHVVEMKICK